MERRCDTHGMTTHAGRTNEGGGGSLSWRCMACDVAAAHTYQLELRIGIRVKGTRKVKPSPTAVCLDCGLNPCACDD